MRKHLLSLYGDLHKIEKTEDLGKTTYETSTIETTDVDEFCAMEVTHETRNKESSDPDEFFLQGPTNLTFLISCVILAMRGYLLYG